jgi:presenilin-like A22 family membrane protease
LAVVEHDEQRSPEFRARAYVVAVTITVVASGLCFLIAMTIAGAWVAFGLTISLVIAFVLAALLVNGYRWLMRRR